jgi:hypothetical protein
VREIDARLADITQTLSGILLETAMEKTAERLWYFGRQQPPVRLAFADRGERVDDGFAIKRSPSAEYGSATAAPFV